MPSSTISSEHPPSDRSPAKPVRVLLADDNQAMLTRVASMLTSECAIVAAVTDGAAALDAAEGLQPDVIVLDISMPGMTGLEVAYCLRAAGSNAALVFLTIHEDEEMARAARAAGGIGYVVKARLASDLMLAIREARAGRPFVSALR
jgi:DNA-binding NarL/FixJ family response regulator